MIPCIAAKKLATPAEPQHWLTLFQKPAAMAAHLTDSYQLVMDQVASGRVRGLKTRDAERRG